MIRHLNGRAARLTLWQIDAIGAAACAALGGLWYVVGMAPLAEARAQHTLLGASVVDMEAEAKRIVHVQRAQERSLVAAQSKLDSTSIKLAPVEQINQRVGTLTRLATDNGLQIDEIKPGTPVPQQRYTSVPIQVSGQGSYRNVAVFLHSLREHHPDIGLTQFEVRGEPVALDRPARYSLQMVWYAAPAPAKRKNSSGLAPGATSSSA